MPGTNKPQRKLRGNVKLYDYETQFSSDEEFEQVGPKLRGKRNANSKNEGGANITVTKNQGSSISNVNRTQSQNRQA